MLKKYIKTIFKLYFLSLIFIINYVLPNEKINKIIDNEIITIDSIIINVINTFDQQQTNLSFEKMIHKWGNQLRFKTKRQTILRNNCGLHPEKPPSNICLVVKPTDIAQDPKSNLFQCF